MERSIHAKFDILSCILTQKAITENYFDRFSLSDTFHIQ